ncbi:hypothetical protein I4U23_023413 [Adineta vaga]|nr:hypothetical protein I4U23_023413 [Adineta vaga]
MLSKNRMKQCLNVPFQTILIVFLTIVVIGLLQNIYSTIKANDIQISSRRYIGNSLSANIGQNIFSMKNEVFRNHNQTFETTVRCVGPLYNQSCLFENLYFFHGTFVILTVKGRQLPLYTVHTCAFNLYAFTPRKRVFKTYGHLERFVINLLNLKIIPSVTVYFGQLWHHNIGHALFDGLYPAYVALMRFPPRHLQPFRILASIQPCPNCWSEDVYSRFAGLGLLKQHVLERLSRTKWFVFDEIVMGSGKFCQRCVQPHLQLAGGVELDASRLFRDRMYRQHGLIPPLPRRKSSMERRRSHDILQAYLIHNKRFDRIDRREIHAAIDEINTYTYNYLSIPYDDTTTESEWPLINVTYLFYNQTREQALDLTFIKQTRIDSRSPIYELVDNSFISQLRLVRQMDIHITGPGTGQMYQTFLADGSVTINLGGLKPKGYERSDKAYTSYLEQHMTSGTPYIKGLYYPINKRPQGIKKEEVMKLIRQAGQMILDGFSLPVNPRENLAPDGQLFVEMCEKDPKFCSSVTIRTINKQYACLDFWTEDFIHENKQWRVGGYMRQNNNVSCYFNRLLLHELRDKYNIKFRGSIYDN